MEGPHLPNLIIKKILKEPFIEFKTVTNCKSVSRATYEGSSYTYANIDLQPVLSASLTHSDVTCVYLTGAELQTYNKTEVKFKVLLGYIPN